MYKLGSLFDGSGGFPLAGALCGIEPVWASEVEPYPIAVTRSRFPKMKHLGDISKINGAEIEPVDIITFGSPCQDLSVAGKRAGLKHEANGDEETTRSGLFMEAVRIIKEMREATDGRYPTFALWENVPGAFSSNKGEDFRTVLEELIKIKEPCAVMPAVPAKGWAYADSYCGDGWSIAYRVFDAQYWGVPQRRRRIHLVADFRGERAREILFEREGVRGYFAQGRTPWQSIAADAEGSVGTDDRARTVGFLRQLSGVEAIENISPTILAAAGESGNNKPAVAYTLKIRSGCEGGGKGALVQEDKSATPATNNDQYLFQPVSNLLLDDQGCQQINVRTDDKSPTLRAEAHGNMPAVVCKEQYLYENHSQDTRYKGPLDVCPMLPAQLGTGGNNTPFVVEGEPVVFNGENVTSPINKANPKPGDPCHTLGTDNRNYLVYCLQGSMIGRKDKNGPQGDGVNEDVSFTQNTADRHAVVYALDRASFNQGQNAKFDFSVLRETSPTLIARGPNATAYGTDVGWLSSCENHSPTLLARQYKDPHLVTYDQANRYIVRRLTPTECARLQGFPDRWGDIEDKTDFSDEEYAFWTEVRCTHAIINGRGSKTYGKKQMLTWYNKLHTDSAEYKMWGNGIALPPALYCMQGMAEALNNQ